MAFSCLRWLCFEDAANVLCVSSRMLRKSAAENNETPFPFEEQRGRMVTQSGPAYAWLKRHTKCPHLKKPADFDEWQIAEQNAAKCPPAVQSQAQDFPREYEFRYDLECRFYSAANRYFATMPEREALKALNDYISIELDAFGMMKTCQNSIEKRYPNLLKSPVETVAQIIGVKIDELRVHLLNEVAASERRYGKELSGLIDPGSALYYFFQDKSGDSTDPDFAFDDDVESGNLPVPMRKDLKDKREGLSIIRGIIQMRLSMWDPAEGLTAVQRYLDRELNKS